MTRIPADPFTAKQMQAQFDARVLLDELILEYGPAGLRRVEQVRRGCGGGWVYS